MKLKNKKTGEIRELCVDIERPDNGIRVYADDGIRYKMYNSLAELCDEWEDYEELKVFYIVEQQGIVGSRFRTGEEYEKKFKQIGNYFETEEEAEKAVEKLKAWKRLKSCGFKFKRYKYSDILEGTIGIEAQFNNDGQADKDLDLLFGGEE